ncbi:chromatin assembly complex protein [Amanita muscaria]
MRFRTLEIRWHDNKPISTCDFQPAPFKKARPPAGQEKNFATHAYRFATGGEDNHVRLWMVHPHIRPAALAEEDASSVPGGPRPPRVEYLATLSRHSAAVNVVRWSPNGDFIASAGDDGMIIIWAPSTSPQAATYGSDLSPDELQYEKEYWKPRTSFRCTTMQVYDLAWSPTGEYIIAGSTDNTARVFASADGKCVCEIAEHTHFVQGVAWDPLNEYIATQSSDRSMHIYRLSTKNGVFEAHAVGRNTRLSHRHSRTPSVHNGNGTRARHGSPRPPILRRESNSGYSDAESDRDIDVFGTKDAIAAPLTPSTSVASTPSTALSASMFPPPPIVPSASNPSAPPSVVGNNPSSRRSSFSGSNAPSSPQVHPHSYARYGRSPSPMPPLPAIRTPLTPPVANIRLYGDENFTNFFRRLTFSPDGGLLLTPAGQFEDPTVVVPPDGDNTTPTRGRKGRQTSVGAQGGTTQSQSAQANSNSCVYIYSRANFARPPIAQLPGHKKASVAVRFSPVLYELRPSVVGPSPVANANGEQEPRPQAHDGPKVGVIDKGVEGSVDVDITAALNPASVAAAAIPVISHRTPTRQKHRSSSQTPLAAPTPRRLVSGDGEGNMMAMSPSLLPTDIKPLTPAASKPSTPAPSTSGNATVQSATSAGVQTTGSVFALPYRMMFAVVTMDTVTIYDTQQSTPFCLLTMLHYDEFTDVSWSPDGQCLMLSSRDGYCTLVVFDEIVPAHHTQQHALQLQSIAHNLSVPLSLSTPHHGGTTLSAITQSPLITPVSAGPSLSHPPPFTVTPSVPKKRTGGDPPLTPASTDGSESGVVGLAGSSTTAQPVAESGGLSNSNNTEKGKKSEQEKVAEPPKKKRRVQLTRVGDLGS